MEFSMNNFETANAINGIAGGGGGAVNVQHKKQFGLADVDNNEIKLENDDWNIDSIFPLNNDFLNDFNDLADINMDANWTDAYDYMSSPTSTGTGTESENDHDMLGMKPMTNQMLSPPQNLISSSSSDSGLSSDHLDFDMNFDQLGTDLLQQPLLSTQVIPDVPEQVLTQKTIKQEINDDAVQPTIKLTQSNRIITQNVPEITKKFVQIKSTNGYASLDKSPKPKVQIVKKIPSNVVQITGDSNATATVKLNQTVIGGNMISNTPIVINKVNGNISGIRKVIQLKKSPNQKPIILPFSLKNGTDIRSIKIINPSSCKSSKILMAASNLLQEYKQNEKQNAIIMNKPIKVEPKYENDSMSDPSDCESYKFEDMIVHDDDDDADDYNNDSDQGVEPDQQSEYPKLILSGEEKRLLAKEGIALPAHYPLTKHEERELKRIRRKIRNKISAQDSRKRKKEYVDGLEERVKKCTDENHTLLKRIKMLQSQNQNLINQMKKMQNLLTKGGNKSVQPATCLMVLLMSMALIAAPQFKPKDDSAQNELMQTQELLMQSGLDEAGADAQQNRRLLYDSKEKFSDLVADEEMSSDFGSLYGQSESNSNNNNNEHNYAEIQRPPISKIGSLIDFDVDDTVWVPKINTSRDNVMAKEASNPVVSQQKNANGIDHGETGFKTFAGIGSEPIIAHTKPAKNLSDLPSDDAYQLNIDSDDIKNIISLDTEMMQRMSNEL